MLNISKIPESGYFPAIFAYVFDKYGKIFSRIQILRLCVAIFIARFILFFRGGKIMSSISGIDSNNLVNASLNSLKNSVNSDATQKLAQLFDALNLSSSASGSSDLTTSLLQSLEESGLSQSNSTSIQTAMENLLKSSGNSGNSSAQEILNKYISSMSNTASLIKTMV